MSEVDMVCYCKQPGYHVNLHNKRDMHMAVLPQLRYHDIAADTLKLL